MDFITSNDVLLKIIFSILVILGVYAAFILTLASIEYMIKMLKDKFDLDIDYLIKYSVRIGFFILMFYFVYNSL